MSRADPLIVEGEVPFHVPTARKPCLTRYWVHGDLKSGKTPLVVLHGGPGSTHRYVDTHSILAKTHEFPVVLYDQIGNGESTHLQEKMGDTTFWTIDLFIQELENLLTHLDINGRFDLLGHSWGGMLALSFIINNQPKGLRRLVLASSLASQRDWLDAARILKAELPQEMREVIDKHEMAGTVGTNPKEYWDARMHYYSLHLCRTKPTPPGLAADMRWHGIDDTVCLTMNGENEFYMTGPLKDFDVTKDLHKVTVPTLLTNGRYDCAADSVVQPLFDNLPCVKWVHFSESSHTPHLEETERYMKIVGDFLNA